MGNSIRFVCLAALLFAAGCGGDDIECGAGTRQVGEACVAAEGMNNTNENTNSNDNTNPTICGDGTVLEGNACVPVASLSSFTVTAAAVGCDTIVDGVSTVAVTVTAVDADGTTLSDFSGMVSLVGLGGVTVSPSTAMLAAGTGVANVAVNGLSSTARIAAFDSTGTVAGRTDEFSVVEEEVRLTNLIGPPTAVRSGESFNLTANLETNACRPPAMDAAGSIFINADNGVRVVPSQILLDGTASITQSFSADGSPLSETTPVTISGQLSVGPAQTTTVSVIPPIRFSGILSAVASDSDNAVVAFAPASGGEPPYTYTVFRSTTAGVLGDALSPTITGGATTGTYAIGGMNGDSVFFTVRVADSLASDIDSNLVQASVVKGPVVFVDATNTGTADGGAGTPYTTLSAAVADGRLATGGTIYVSAGTYAELPLNFSASAGIQLAGGFTGFTGPSTTAADWMLGQTHTALDYDGTTSLTGTLLTLGANASLSNFDVALAYGGSDVFVAGTTRLEIRDSRVGSIAAGSTGNRIVMPNGDLTVIGTIIEAPTVGGGVCVSGQDGTVTVSGSTASGGATGIAISTNTAASVAALIRDTVIQDSTVGVNVANGMATLRGARFEGITDRSLVTMSSEVDVDNSDFVDSVSGVSVSGSGGLVVTGSRFLGVDRGIDGTMGSVSGERRPLRLINNVFEVNRYGVSITSSATTGVFDTVVRDNVFVSLTSARETALSIRLENEEETLEETLVVSNNTFFEFDAGLVFNVNEGNASTSSPSPLVASFTGNYGRRRAQAGYGDGIEGRLYSSGSVAATVQGNVLRALSSGGLDIRANAGTTTNVDIVDNALEANLGDGQPELSVSAISYADGVAGGAISARLNTLRTPGFGNSSASVSARGQGNVDISLTGNEIIGAGGVFGNGFTNVNVSDNRIRGGAYAGVSGVLGGFGCCSYNNGGTIVEGPKTLAVERNIMEGQEDGALYVVGRPFVGNSNVSVLVRGNTARSGAPARFGSGLGVRATGGTNSPVELDVVGNDLQGSSFGVTVSGADTPESASASVNVRNNLIDSVNGANVQFRPENMDIDANFTENLFRTGTSSNGLFLLSNFSTGFSSTPGNSNVNVALRKNVVELSAEGTLRVTERTNGPTTRFSADISNNILLVDGGASTPLAMSNINGNSSVNFVHNTLSGAFTGNGVSALSVSNSNGNVSVVDNVFDNTFATAASPIVTSSPGSTRIDNNVVWRATTDGTNDRIGVPVFVNPVDRVLVLIVTDPLSNEVEAFGGVLAVGDRVVVAGSMTARTVLAVVPPLATLEGEPIAAASGAVVDALAWSAGSFVGPVPDYRLVDGSVGKGIATDTGDIGAGGGPDPFTSQPMLPAP